MESVGQYFLAAPFFILLVAFVTPRRHWWFLYLFIFLTVSLYGLVGFWAVQEAMISAQFSRNGPGRVNRIMANMKSKSPQAADGRQLPVNSSRK